MPSSDTSKYDVAISFLVRDLTLAQALRDKLSVGLNVFFFPHTQEELAGTDGLESMRGPFLNSRLNLVLYREQWGNTPWTGVEAAAVEDSCLKTRYRSLFFFVVDSTDVLPKWLPDTHIRFNYREFTLDEAVGAVKLRVQEQGGHYEPMTPQKKANLLREEERYQFERSQLKSQGGIERILGSVEALFNAIKGQCDAVNSDGSLEIECELNLREHTCVMRIGRIGMVVRWNQPYSNALDNSGLSVEEYNGWLRFGNELRNQVIVRPPQLLRRTGYQPQLSRARDYGWREEGGSEDEFVPSYTLAEQCVLQLLDSTQVKAAIELA